MYRPTVRCDDVYKEYIDKLFTATSLDRNQIIRLALFSAPFNQLFLDQITKYKVADLPEPLWRETDHGLWLNQKHERLNNNLTPAKQTELNVKREIIQQPIIQKQKLNGGIKIVIE